MKTTPTTGGEAVAEQLPIVAYREFTDFGGWYTYPQAGAPDGRHCENQALTPHAPAQSALDELRAENAALKEKLQEQALQALSDDGQWMERTDELRREVEALRAENFKLAASQCPDGYGDEGGTPRCCAEKQITTLRQRVKELEDAYSWLQRISNMQDQRGAQ